MNWTVRDLAEKAGVHRNTVSRAETDQTVHGHAVAQIVRTFEAAGVEFTNGSRPGIRLRPREAALLRFAAYIRAHPHGAHGALIPTPEEQAKTHAEVLALVDKVMAVETYQEFEKIRDALQELGIFADNDTIAAVAAALPDETKR